MKKSYYAIIPANVRYDKGISANAKLLFGEISALCNEKGYCWAKNKYFAELYSVTQDTVSRWIIQLEEGGYISKKIDKLAGNKRKISIVDTYPQKSRYLPAKKSIPTRKKVDSSINITYNNTNKKSDEVADLSYEPIEKQTYNTKRKTYEKKGLNYTPRPMTEKQKKSIPALQLILYFRIKAKKIHGLKFMLDYKEQMAKKNLSARNKKIRNLFITGLEKIGVEKGKEYIDWYLGEPGRWCDYSPDNCFSDSTIEQFINRKPKIENLSDIENKKKWIGGEKL